MPSSRTIVLPLDTEHLLQVLFLYERARRWCFKPVSGRIL